MGQMNALLAGSHRFIHALMSLDAGWMHTPAVPARPAFLAFAADVEETLSLLSAALRGRPVRQADFPDLREDHNQLLQSGDPHAERYALVNIEADRSTNSLNTLREQVLARVRAERAD
jgi:hypothetical protein